ncbi:CACTA en-spm transposon protein [Cucumis melo var. makuwa]|uniref:CACTA en-spm transposon protein n=1 Tax=Cucumis melo var. makuwa TaxID=1194695 RepID=A0A5D3DH31_CUCMM|nr:CACTA en-spm transposon protein [Cucumis melo var. makuwa]
MKRSTENAASRQRDPLETGRRCGNAFFVEEKYEGSECLIWLVCWMITMRQRMNLVILILLAWDLPQEILQATRFSNTIGNVVREGFPVCCETWSTVPLDVIEMAKSQVQSTKDGQQCGLIELFKKTHAKDDNWVNKASHAAHSRMVELEGLQTLEGSQPPSEEEICEIVLGRHPGGPKSKPRKHRYSSKSISSIKQKAYEQEIEIRNLKEQLDMKKSNIQEEREVRNATKEKLMTKKEELMATKTEVDNLKELMKQFMASQEGTSK